MKKTTKILMLLLIVSLLVLGIGYAAIQNITLNISGTATADPNQANFKVKFSGIPEVSDSVYVTTGITNDTNATINVSGLTQKGQTASAIFEIENASSDLSADVSVTTTNSNTEYFTLSSKLTKTSLEAGEKTTVKVTTELTKTPISESVSSTIGVQLIAAPVQPGSEGTSGIINDYSQSPYTLDLVTNANIEDSIDLGNNIIGEETTTDDWKILYKDENAVYAILADYLPASKVPEEAELLTNPSQYKFGVWADTRDLLIDGISNKEAWAEFTNGISGAVATGSPTAELLMDSYNVKNGTELSYTERPKVTGNLYRIYTKTGYNCFAYWLCTPHENDSNALWSVTYDGEVVDDVYGFSFSGVRPVVELPVSTKCSYSDGIWTVIK